MSNLVFDLSRISTAISPGGTVHITEFSGLETLCGRKFKFGSDVWRENHEDKQPTCSSCINVALHHGATYPSHRL
jgi:hypothetical protein